MEYNVNFLLENYRDVINKRAYINTCACVRCMTIALSELFGFSGSLSPAASQEETQD